MNNREVNRVMFCNISYMKEYRGIMNGDTPKGAGSWVKKHGDAHEKWNFLNVDGNCYGFVQITGQELHIERLEGVGRKTEKAENVTIVWCSPKGKDAVIVGWYKNATVFRNYKESTYTIDGDQLRDYMCMAKASDSYLLPESQRKYTIKRAARAGTGRGFGQSNVWYADSDYAKENIVPKVLDYIENYEGKRINRQNDFFEDKGDKRPLSIIEDYKINEDIDKQTPEELLPLLYREFHTKGKVDTAYFIGGVLSELHQYHMAAEWMEKVVAMEGYKDDSVEFLLHLYYQIGDEEKLGKLIDSYITPHNSMKDIVKVDCYCMMAEVCRSKALYTRAVNYLNKAIELQDIEDRVREDLKAYKYEILCLE